MSLRTIPSFLGLIVSLSLFLVLVVPSRVLAQECRSAVEVGDQFTFASSVGAGPNGVDGAKLTISLTSEAVFVSGTESASRGTWTVMDREAMLDLGDLAPNESVSYSIDLLAVSAGTATVTFVFTSAAGGRAEGVCTVEIEAAAPMPGSISGTKWNDLNGNGTRDAGDGGLAGWTIYVDENGNDAFDAGEPSATTGADGSYTIGSVDAGAHTVREVLQSGWTQTFPSGGEHLVSVGAGETTPGVDFGNVMMAAPKEADLSIGVDATKEGDEPVSVGDTLSVVIDGENNGPDEAEGVMITLRIDANGNVVIVEGSAENCDNGGVPEQVDTSTMRWDLAQVPPGQRYSCTVKVRTVAPGLGSVEGSITSSTDDPNPGNNTDGFSTSINESSKRADLMVTKVAEEDTVFVGDTLSYVVTVTNNGPAEATNVRIRDVVFSDSLMFLPASVPTGCTLSQNNGQLDCGLGTLAPGATVTIRYKGLPKLLGFITNLVDVTADEEDPNIENNIASARAHLRGGADVSVEKVALVGGEPATTVALGDTITYNVTVKNNGPETAFLVETDDLAFSDSLIFVDAPENCTLGTATDDDTGRPLSTMQCRHAAILEPGESEMATYRAVVTGVGVVTNQIEVTGVPRDLNPENNFAEARVTVVPLTVDYSLDAEASADNVDVGDAVTFDFSCSPDQAAEKCEVKVRFQTDEWTDVQIHQGMFTTNGTTTPVDEDDEEQAVEVDPEGFPAGTTQMTYSFTGGFSTGGDTYRGSFTMTADQANPNATIFFENVTQGNQDPVPNDDTIELIINIEGEATAVEQDPAAGIPETFALHSNYPNPFNPETTIRFDLRERARVRLRVFNALGQLIETLADEEVAAGTYRWVFDGAGLPSGTYFYRIEAGSFSQTRAMVLLK